MTARRSQAGNLPAELTSFVGRKRQLARVRELLQGARLLTITGPGGAGKTRLALRAAAGLGRAFPDGTWLVELADLADSALLAAAVGRGLGLRDQSGRWPLATIVEYLAARRLLLVVDNCEHHVDACAVLAETLLRACPEVRLLATSRQALGVDGEVVLPLSPLQVEEEAIPLFVERATAARPGFALTDANREAVAEICQRLDGVPLAIELAAARLKVLSVGEILTRLGDRFQLLIAGRRAALPRQQTLRATIDWSHDLLSAEQRILWRRLAVFAGGFELASAEEVCSGAGLPAGRVFEVLSDLVDRSIVSRQENEDRTRFGLIDMLREYGRERLGEAGEEKAFRLKHRARFRRLALEIEAGGWGEQQRRSLDRVEAEHANLRSALELCLARREAGLGLEIACTLGPYWQVRGYVGEGIRWLRSFLELERDPSLQRARGLALAGDLSIISDVQGGRVLLEEGLVLARVLGVDPLIGAILRSLGIAAVFEGDHEAAFALLGEALGIARRTGDRRASAIALFQLGLNASFARQGEAALVHQEEAIRLATEDGEPWILSYAYWGMGLELWFQGRHGRAEDLQRQALRLKREIEDRSEAALCLETLAWNAASERRFERAACLVGVAQAAWESIPTAPYGPFLPYRRACEEACGSALGERGYAAAVNAGARLGFAEGVAFALEEKRRAQAHASTTPRLTPREMEVAALIAEGLTNREIAHRLVISERTVDTHVQNILSRLGLDSRAQIAAWSARKDT